MDLIGLIIIFIIIISIMEMVDYIVDMMMDHGMGILEVIVLVGFLIIMMTAIVDLIVIATVIVEIVIVAVMIKKYCQNRNFLIY